MGCTLGRVGRTTAQGGDGLTLESPKRIAQNGDRLRVGGEFAVTAAHGRVLAQQLMGYPDPDEEVIPFAYDATDSGGVLDGYYFVDGITVDWVKLAAGLFSWDANLTRVPGFGAPLFEIVCTGALRSNVHSITTASAYAWVGYPSAASAVRFAGAASNTAVTEYGASGNDVIALYATGTPIYTEVLLYSVGVADFYDAACTVWTGTRVGSSTAPDVSGHRLIVGTQAANVPTAWMISNDLVRVLPGPNAGEILVGQWEDSAHSPAGANAWTYKAYKIIKNGATGTSAGDGDTFTIIRNGPECVTVRVWFDHGSQVASYTDFTLRRGSPVVEGVSTIVGTSATLAHGVGRYSTEATSSATGGIIATSDDANSNKFRIRSPQTVTADNTNGTIYLTSAAQRFAFGIDTDYFSGIDVTDGYWGAVTHRQSMTVR